VSIEDDVVQVSYNLPPAAVAAAVLRLDAARPDPNVTPAQLQRVLYLAQGHYLAATGRRLFDAPVTATHRGPVVAPVQRECAPYTGQVIVHERGYATDPGLPRDALEFLTRVWEQHGDQIATTLARLTHARDPWAITCARGEGTVIPDQAMIEHFSYEVPARERVLHPGIVVVTQEDLDNLDRDEDDIIDRALTALLAGETHD